MKKYILIFFLIFLYSGVFANNTVSISYMSQKPQIDGIIEKGEWNTTSLTGFHRIGSYSQDKYKTIIYIGYDNDNLYYAFKCYGNNKPKGLPVREKKDYWEDDAIELFFLSDIYYQVVANAYGGLVALSNTNIGDANSTTTQMNIDYTIKTHISSAFDEIGAKPEDLYWEGEVSIPWKSLEMNPKPGDEVKFLVSRDKQADGIGNSNFGYIYKSFYEFDNFSKGIFTKDEPIIQMDDSKIVGGDLTFINPTDKEISLKINDKILKNKDELKNISEEIKLSPKETKSYTINDFPKGIYNLISTVSYNDKIMYNVENEIINTEIFKYNYKKEKNLLIIDFDFDGINHESYPFVDLRIMKGNDMIHGYMITINGLKTKDHYEIDTKDLKGEYDLICNINGVYDQNTKLNF